MLHLLDYIIIAGYMVFVVVLGIFLSFRQKSSEDFFLASKSLGWVSIGLSLFASNISSATLIGLAGAAYMTGIAVSAYEWAAAFILVFFAIFFIPYLLNNNVFTLPEFLEKRFDRKCRSYFSGLTIVNSVFIDMTSVLFAGALVVTYFFPQIPFWLAAVMLVVFAAAYTILGGLSAVVYTDTVQAVILIIGSIFITVIAFFRTGGTLAGIIENTPPEMLELIRPIGDPTMPWPGLLIGVPILGFYYWCTNQYIAQRVLGAKDVTNARNGAIFGGFLKLTSLFIMVLPGVFARQLFPDLETADMVFPQMISVLLPIGIKGLVLAGLMAAIMSSIDSNLHSVSTLVTMDFVKKYRPNLSSKKLMSIGRMITFLLMTISLLWLPVIASFNSIFTYLQNALSYLVPQIAAVYLIGLFWSRINSKGAFWGLITGHAFALLFFVLIKTNVIFEIHFLYLAGIFFAVTALSMIVISYTSTPPDQQKMKGVVWSKGYYKEDDVVWYKDYRFYSVVLIITTLLIVFLLR